ncbi:MAG: PIN domain-containing protein [candidate division NC10 bacterium]|nr:PIN domain-containing protein [candidate division NC10 bacterium]
MIFADTSWFYALADRDDINHREAVRLMDQALTQGETFLTHNYILVETSALLHRRLGLPAAKRFLADAEAMTIHWVTKDEHRQAADQFRRRTTGRLSLVDVVSFLVMRHYGLGIYLGFDEDFNQEGFRCYVLPT